MLGSQITAMKRQWRELLLALALDERLLDIKASLPASFDLLPSSEGSWWYPKEWSGGQKDTIAVEVGGRLSPIDALVHELGHSMWTWRSPEGRTIFLHWHSISNLCEDVRIEYRAVTRWGWKFSWDYPEVPIFPVERYDERDGLLLGMFISKIATSRGEEVPEVWKGYFGKELWEKIEQAYQELISVETESEFENFLKKYFGDGNYSPSGFVSATLKGHQASQDVSKYISELEREKRKAEKLLSYLSGQEERSAEWFRADIPTPQVPPSIMSLLNRLVGERRVKTPAFEGRLDHRRYIREKEDCFRSTRILKKPKVNVILDTSGSMKEVGEDIRPLLLGLNALAKRGSLEGKVVLVSGGNAYPIELPTKLPIHSVVFEDGSTGYKKALPFIDRESYVLVISDLLIGEEDISFVKALNAYFLYGGEMWEFLREKALKAGFPQRRLIFSPSVVEALKKLLHLLGL